MPKRTGNQAGIGPRDDFEHEVLEHLDALFGVAVRLTRNRPEGEDLVQDTLVKAMRARHQFAAGTNMRAWLLRILTNTFINHYRRGGLERSVLAGPDADPLVDGWVSASTMEAMRDPESRALRSVLSKEIERALDQLPEEFRLVVLLADVQELSYREISEVVGCPIGTVMSRLHRGRRLLRTQLYEHARALGIIGPETVLFEEGAPVDLEEYRRRKGAAS